MARSQQSINKDIACKRDVLAMLQSELVWWERKDIYKELSKRNDFRGMGYSANRVIQALKDLEADGKLEKKRIFGSSGNWPYVYRVKEGE